MKMLLGDHRLDCESLTALALPERTATACDTRSKGRTTVPSARLSEGVSTVPPHRWRAQRTRLGSRGGRTGRE